jgi:hypothetical protein
MVRPLIVDTSRLETAGNTLESLAFPSPPPPIAAAGSDTASAAINATMPQIESPVLDGLPAVRAALMSTAANIATAATIYAQADQTLGENLMQLRFNVSGANTVHSGTRRADTSAREPDQQSAAEQLSTQLSQLNGSMGAAPAGPRPDAAGEDAKTDERQLESVAAPDESGAAGGRHATASTAPVQTSAAATTSASASSGGPVQPSTQGASASATSSNAVRCFQ